MSALHPTTPRVPALARLANLRVSGVLTTDAQLCQATGQHALLMLHMQPAQGLPYDARIDLGTDVADHMAAQATLPSLRKGALVSVAGHGLELRSDHGHAALRVVKPHSAVAFSDPITPPQEG